MDYGFNHDQFKEDIDDFVTYVTAFGKSFGPSAKKIQGKQLGFFEESYIRFRLGLVEMGISKVIRTCIAWIVAIILFFTVFIHADITVQFLLIFGFIVYYAWLMSDHLVVDKAPVSATAGIIVGVQEFTNGVWDGIKGLFTDIFSALNPFGKKDEPAAAPADAKKS